MAQQIEEEIVFGPLYNSQDISMTPDGRVYAMSNVTLQNGIVEGGPRYGTVWKRTGFNANDVGLGLFYAEYGTSAEYLAIIQYSGEAFARLHKVNVTTGVFTQVTNGGVGPNPQVLASSTRYSFVQYEDQVYIAIDDGSQQILKRTVGAANGIAAACGYFTPTYNRGTVGADITRPPEIEIQQGTAYLDPAAPGGVTLIYTGGAGFKISVAAGTGACNFKVVVDLGFDLDMKYADNLQTLYTLTGGVGAWAGVGTVVGAVLSTDGDSTIDAAFMARFQIFATQFGITAGEASGSKQSAGPVFGQTADYVGRKPVRRIVYYFSGVQTGANPAAVSIDTIKLGGVTIWDVAVPGGAATTGYAVRFGNTKKATAEWSNLIKLPALKSLDLLGTAVVDRLGTTHYTGAIVSVSVPFNPEQFNKGYNKVEYFRESSTTAGDYYSIGKADHKDGGDMSVIDTTLQSVVNAGATTPTFDSVGPNNAAAVMGIWKQHLVLADDRKLYFSFSALPDQFRPSKNEIQGSYATNAEDLGRTVFVNPGRTLSAKAIIGVDGCYLGTGKDAEYMIGDTANTATPPRNLPGSYGILGPRSNTGYRNGAVMAHEPGLFYYNVTRAYAFSSDTPQEDPGQELTIEVRGSWEQLRGSSSAGMVVASHNDEIWAFNNPAGTPYYMRFLRPDPNDGHRDWEFGTWPEVVGWAAALGRGLRVMLVNGSVARVGWNAAGAAYTTDDGTPVNWSVSTGERIASREKIVGIMVEGAGAPTVTVTVYDGKDIPVATDYAVAGEANRVWRKSVNIPPGMRFKISASGVVGTDSIRKLVLIKEPAGIGYGN